jgi:thiol-disulfide isomerase/thioredoxin
MTCTARGALSCALLTVLALALPAAAGDWASWEPALARHKLQDFDGRSTSLQQMRGDVVVLNFWASWCKPCKKELLHLEEGSQDLAGQPARILAVSIDRDRRKAQRFVEASNITLPVYHDGVEGLARELELPFLPCTVVVDAWGHVVRVSGGGSEVSLREIMGTVRALLPDELPQPEAGEVSG